MDIRFNVVVHVPDDAIDADGTIKGSEEWALTARQQGRPEGSREPVADYAQRMLVCYTSCTRPGVRATVTRH